jgi:hypothetical protein
VTRKRKNLGDAGSCAFEVQVGPSYRTICITENQKKVLFNDREPKKPLGGGAHACAWDRGDGTVVKITTDRSDIQGLKALRGSPFVAKVHDTFLMAQAGKSNGIKSGDDFYAAIVDKLEPVETELGKAITAVAGGGAKGVDRCHLRGFDRKQCEKIKAWMAEVDADFSTRGVLAYQDFSGSNVGVDASGRLRIIDAGSAVVAGEKRHYPQVLHGPRKKRRR